MKHTKALLILTLAVALVASNFLWYMKTVSPPEEIVSVRFAKQYGYHYGPQIIMEKFNLVQKYSSCKVVCEWNTISGGATINEAIVAGSLDFAAMGTAPVITGIDQGIGTKLLLSMGAKEHELWTWRDDIQSIADIKPEDKVAAVKPNSIEEVGLIKAFSDLGRSKEDAEKVVIYLKHPEAYQLMEQREIDVDFTGAPWTSLYKSDPAYHKIGSDSEIWGLSLPGSCFIGTTAFREEHPDVFVAVMMAWIEAVRWIDAHQEEAADIIGEYYEYEPEERWKMWTDANMQWDPYMGLLVMEDFAEVMYELGLTEEQLILEEILFEETIALVGK